MRSGDSLELRPPNGSPVKTTVAGVEMMMDAMRHPIGIRLPQEVRKENVPVGTEVWSIG